MAITRHTVSGNVGDLVRDHAALVDDWSYRNPVTVRAWLETNIPDGEAVVDTTTGGGIALGPRMLTLDGSLNFSEAQVIATNATGLNWSGLQYRVVVEYPNRVQQSRDTWHSPWFDVTGNVDVKDAVELSYAPPTATSALLTQMEAILAEQEEIAGLTSADAAIAALVKGTAGAGPLTRAALGASLTGHGSNLAAFVAGLAPGTEYVYNLTDGAGTLLDIVSGVA